MYLNCNIHIYCNKVEQRVLLKTTLKKRMGKTKEVKTKMLMKLKNKVNRLIYLWTNLFCMIKGQ